MLQLEALHIEACKRAAQFEERERQIIAAQQHPVAELQSQLAGDLQQRSVELGASQARAAQAASKLQHLSDDLTTAENLLTQAQSELAVQAKGMFWNNQFEKGLSRLLFTETAQFLAFLCSCHSIIRTSSSNIFHASMFKIFSP